MAAEGGWILCDFHNVNCTYLTHWHLFSAISVNIFFFSWFSVCFRIIFLFFFVVVIIRFPSVCVPARLFFLFRDTQSAAIESTHMTLCQKSLYISRWIWTRLLQRSRCQVALFFVIYSLFTSLLVSFCLFPTIFQCFAKFSIFFCCFILSLPSASYLCSLCAFLLRSFFFLEAFVLLSSAAERNEENEINKNVADIIKQFSAFLSFSFSFSLTILSFFCFLRKEKKKKLYQYVHVFAAFVRQWKTTTTKKIYKQNEEVCIYLVDV